MSNNITRRELLLGSAGALTIAATTRAAESPAANRPPNILFILADDLGYADLSVYGRDEYRTPVLDRLARQGLLMTAGYANSAVCSATRFGLITGRYQYRLPSGLFEPGGQTPDYGLPDGHPTLPSLLKKSGYRTSLFGKWHLGMPPFSGPTQRGYDYFFGFLGGATDYFRIGGGAQGIGGEASGASAAPAGPSPTALYENDHQVVEPGYLTDLLAERAGREIAQCAATRTPFFISLHFNAPHWPWEGPTDEATSKNIATLRHSDGGSIRKFGEMVVALDSAIGRVLSRLKTAGVERDTLVIFTSDNGGERFSNTWPFIGAKGELLEGGLRVPLIARWPAHIQAGRRSDQLMMSMDFLPTLLAAAGGTPDAAYPPDGENLLPVLLGQQSPHMRKVFWRYKANEQAVAREGDWKYLKMANQEFLFNVAEDQRERANLKGKMPELFERLKREYGVWNAAMLPYPANSFSESRAASGPIAIDVSDVPDFVLHYGAHPDQCIDLWHGGARSGSRALIVLLHGGFWRPIYDRAHMVPMAQSLARAGWPVANVEYRREPGNPDVTMSDVSTALEFLAVKLQADSDDGRMVVAGFSAGGHLALWLAATSTQRRLIGALGMAPVADLRCAAALNLGNGALDLFLGTHRERLPALDPAQLPMPTRAVAIIHGETDDTVPVAVSQAYLSVHSAIRLRCVPAAGHYDLIDPQGEAWHAVMEELVLLADERAA